MDLILIFMILMEMEFGLHQKWLRVRHTETVLLALPEMYIDYTEFADEAVYLQDLYLDPYYSGNVNIENLLYSNAGGDASDNPYYFLNWSEGFVFGGHDNFYSESRAETNEIRFDITSQMTDKWRSRWGIDLKSHRLTSLIKFPWLQGEAKRQRFAEQWDDYGRDGIYWLDFQEMNLRILLTLQQEHQMVWDGRL